MDNRNCVKEQCIICHKIYVTFYDLTDNQPKNCPFCDSDKINMIEEDYDYRKLLTTGEI